jgi:hypothetical protein
MANIDFTNLDPDVVKLSKAIRQTEGGNFDATNPDAGGWSVGAYQWHGKDEAGARQHFQAEASQFGLDPHDFSPVNQDKVAYAKMKAWKDKGYHAGEIAAMWNGAKIVDGRPQAINPKYVEKVQAALGNPVQNPGHLPATTYDPAPFGTGEGKIDLSNTNQPVVDKAALGDSLGKGANAVGDAVGQVVNEKNAKKVGSGLLHAVGNFGVGVVKGTGQALNSTAGRIADKILPPQKNNPGAVFNSSKTAKQVTEEQFTPKGASQKVGAFTGKYVLPTVAGATSLGAGATAMGVDVPAVLSAGVNAVKSAGKFAYKGAKVAGKTALLAEALAHPKQVLGIIGHLLELAKSGVE